MLKGQSQGVPNPLAYLSRKLLPQSIENKIMSGVQALNPFITPKDVKDR